jgi:hypothetical protein
MKWITMIAFAVTTAAAQEYTYTNVVTKQFEFEGKVVTGAPYSAQAVTETTQVLADGNRINRKSTSMMARDSMGRVRREQNLSFVGPWSVEGNNASFISISDPVAGARYTLDAKAKSAVKVTMNAHSEGAFHQKLEAELKAAREKEEAALGERRRKVEEPRNTSKTESLGSKVIEGVQAVGKRSIETIQAGRMGNERPIDIINETWYSPELQMVVMSKHSDPRSGDVVYTLTNIQRAEPDPAMFQVPGDYQLREESGAETKVRLRK